MPFHARAAAPTSRHVAHNYPSRESCETSTTRVSRTARRVNMPGGRCPEPLAHPRTPADVLGLAAEDEAVVHAWPRLTRRRWGAEVNGGPRPRRKRSGEVTTDGRTSYCKQPANATLATKRKPRSTCSGLANSRSAHLAPRIRRCNECGRPRGAALWSRRGSESEEPCRGTSSTCAGAARARSPRCLSGGST